MATPGYGKRPAPGQRPRQADDFALLPVRERYIAGFIERLPTGAAMSVKSLARQLPLYGQQAVSSALTALSVAGYLRRVRCPIGHGDEIRWSFRTFWSRTARDNEWWNTYLASEAAQDPRAPLSSQDAAPPPPWVPDAEGEAAGDVGKEAAVGAPQEADSRVDLSPVPASGPDLDPAPDPDPASESAPAPVPEPASAPASASASAQAEPAAPAPAEPPADTPSPAYLALARLGRADPRLALSAADCTALEALAAAWLDRGVDGDYVVQALTAGLPAHVGSPVGLVRRRLTDKIPPRVPAAPAPGAPALRVLVECTACGVPGRPEALPDGLCRSCRKPADSATGHGSSAAAPADAPDIRTHITGLRDLLRAP